MSPIDPDQAALFEALAASGALGPGPVTRIDTSLSAVFLCGDRAFKAMRAVRLRYVDFGTLEQRRAACFAELGANRAAPALYLGAAPILRSGDGALTLGPVRREAAAIPGEAPLDWLVVMRRFEAEDAFDHRLGAGRLDLPVIERLADVIAERHRQSPARPVDGAGSLAANIDSTGATLGECGLDPAAVAAWVAGMAAARARGAGQLAARARHGRLRRCHGDLHLGNLCLLGGAPTPFDAIAFNDSLADIDIAYDAAFTAMDLIARGRPDLASAFASRWLGATGDWSGLALWPLFVAQRAGVRAMVAGLEGDAETAAARLALGLSALERPAPRLIAIGGASGAGKTTVARRIAPKLAAMVPGPAHLRSDVARKRLLGLAPEARAPAEAYAPEVSARMLRRMLRDAGRALRAGAAVIWDATFLSRSDRIAVAALADRSGVRFDGVWLDLPAATRAARADARAAAGADASDADGAIARAQAGDPVTEPRWRRFDAAAPAEALDGAVLAFLNAQQTASP